MPLSREVLRTLRDKHLQQKAQDVPTFTLVAWDVTAARTIRDWVEHARDAGVPEAKLAAALEHVSIFEDWAKENPERMKTPD